MDNCVDNLEPSTIAISDKRQSSYSNVSEETNVTSIQAAQHDDETKKNFQYPYSFLLRIPKSDLHVHLDGSIRISTLIDLAKQQDISLPSYDEEELKATVFPKTYASLEEYLRGFGYITTVLRTPEALERVAYEVAMDAYNVGVRYIEVRFAPQLHVSRGAFFVVSCSS